MAVHNAPLTSAIKAGVTNPINALLNFAIKTEVTNPINSFMKLISRGNFSFNSQCFWPFYLWYKDLIAKYLNLLGPNTIDGWDPH